MSDNTKPEEIKPNESEQKAGWGVSSKMAGGFGWGWGKIAQSVTAVADSASKVGKKFEEIVMDDPNTKNNKDSNEAPKEQTSETPQSNGLGVGTFWNAEEIMFIKNVATGGLERAKKVAVKSLEAIDKTVTTVHDLALDMIVEEEPNSEIETSTNENGEISTSKSKSMPGNNATFDQFYEYFEGPTCMKTLETCSAECFQKVTQNLSNLLTSQERELFVEKYENIQSILDPSQLTQIGENPALALRCESIKQTHFGLHLMEIVEESKQNAPKYDESTTELLPLLDSLVNHATVYISKLAASTVLQLGQLADKINNDKDVSEWVEFNSSEGSTNGNKSIELTEKLRDFMLLALIEMSNICSYCSGVAGKVGTQARKQLKTSPGASKDLETVGSKARAVKGEVYVVQGKATTVIMDSCEKLVGVMKYMSHREMTLYSSTVN